LVNKSVKAATVKTYNSAQTRFLKFCQQYELEHLPATSESILLYVAFLHQQGLKGSSIKVYLAAVRNLHVKNDFADPCSNTRVKMAVKGAVNCSTSPVRKLPITYDILCKLVDLLDGRNDKLMLQLAMCVGFYGCLRAGELCVSDTSLFDPAVNLCWSDVTVDEVKKALVLFIKRSKTDSKNLGVSVRLGCSGKPVCAYCAFLLYRSSRADTSPLSPLFVNSVGAALKKKYFVSTTRLLLSFLGYDAMLFSGHSFRAGCATTAANQGFNQWEIKMLGRWSSECYNIYLRNPAIVNTFAERLAF
jgi:hypothetical protein